MGRIAVLEAEAKKKDLKIATLESRVAQLMAELRLALYRQFGKSSEQLVGQADLPFDDLKLDETPESVEAESEAAQVHRKKAGRKPLADNIPRVDHFHDLTEAEKICACGHQRSKIGEDISEKLNMIPAQVWVDRHHYAKYACELCQGLSDESKPAVTRATGEPDLIPRSIITPGLLAHIWTAKFCDHLPFYRQEAGFARIGAQISRQDMVNWTMKVTGMISPLIELIDQNILAGEVIQQDETPVKVLKLDRTGKEGLGYMWLARGGPPKRKAVRYRFAPGRGHEHAKKYLKNFGGFHQCDGLGAYDLAAEGTSIKLVGCWAHARRKFMDALKATPSDMVKDAIGRIKKLYELERDSRTQAKKDFQTPDEFNRARKEILGPYIQELEKWIRHNAAVTLPESKLGQAFDYTLGQWEKLARFLDHPELTPDNNMAENAIRPFVLGRKNWLFSGNDAGAEASCRVFTLIETAKINGLEPYAYLHSALKQLQTIIANGTWESLLPWNMTIGKI